MWVYSHVISNGSIITQLTPDRKPHTSSTKSTSKSKPTSKPSKSASIPKAKLMRLNSIQDLVHPHNPVSNPKRRKALSNRNRDRITKTTFPHVSDPKPTSESKFGSAPSTTDSKIRQEADPDTHAAASASAMGISLEQMLALEAAEAAAAADDLLSSKMYIEAFKRFDQDGSGDLSPDELRSVLASVDNDLPEEEIERIIAEADTDGDGSIDYHEFTTMMQARKRLRFMASKLGEVTRDPASPNINNNHQDLDPKLRSALCLAPLKLPHHEVRRRKHPRRRSGGGGKKRRKKRGKSGAAGLRRELKACDIAVAELDEKLREEVQWVQEHCNVTSLRGQLYCKKWGMQKLHNVMKRLEYKEVIAAWGIWRALVLHRRNQEQAELYMKFKGSRRLTALFANWKKKRMLAAWNSWIAIRMHQRRLEAEAAARQLQRFVRGILGRQAAQSFLRYWSAVKIEALVRGYICRRKTTAMKELLRFERAAIFIQRAYRGYSGKQLAKLILHSHRQAHAATTLQRLHRGFHVRKRLRRRKSAVDIQRVWRGYLEREIVASVRQAVAESIAALRIQACFRGYYGRQRGLELLETRMQVVAEDEAAVRIQSFFRGARCRNKIHGELQAEEASVRVQSFYRGYKGRKRARRMQERRAALKIQRLHRGVLARRRVMRHRHVHDLRARESLRRKEEHAAAMKIQSHVRRRQGQLASHLLEQARLEKEAAERVAAAKKIQAQARRKMAKHRAARQRAARRIQARERGRQARAKRQPPRSKIDHAQASTRDAPDDQRRKVAQEVAAKKIQARARGNLTRARLKRHTPVALEGSAANREGSAANREVDDVEEEEGGDEPEEKVRMRDDAATRIQKHVRKKLAHKKVKAKRKAKAKTKAKTNTNSKKPKTKTKTKTKAKSKGKTKTKTKPKTKNKTKSKTKPKGTGTGKAKATTKSPDAAARLIQKQVRQRQRQRQQGKTEAEAEAQGAPQVSSEAEEVLAASSAASAEPEANVEAAPSAHDSVDNDEWSQAKALEDVSVVEAVEAEENETRETDADSEAEDGSQSEELVDAPFESESLEEPVTTAEEVTIEAEAKTDGETYTEQEEGEDEEQVEVDAEAEAALAQLKHVEELKRTAAATRIQAAVRMYLVRITLSNAQASAISIQAHFRAARDRSKADQIRAELEEEKRKRQEKAANARQSVEKERLAALKIQSVVRGRQGRLRAEILRKEAAKHAGKLRELRRQQEMEASATRIQCAFRMRQAKKVLRSKQEEHEKKLKVLEEQGLKEAEIERIRAEQEREMAAIRIQAMMRGRAARAELKRKLESSRAAEAGAQKAAEDRLRHVSATRIQSLFRGRRSRRRLQEEAEALAARIESGQFEDEAEGGDVGEWVEYWDESSQAVYYYNTLTQEARWEKPAGFGGGTRAVDGDEDNYHYDEQYYNYDGYYDEAGNWIDTTGAVAVAATTEAGATAEGAEYFDQQYVDADGDGYDDRAQAGYDGYEESGVVEWEEYYDDNYNCSYYFNNYTQETVWEPPPGFVSKYTDPYYEAPRYQG